jgi:small subunit ribosomal protein S18
MVELPEEVKNMQVVQPERPKPAVRTSSSSSSRPSGPRTGGPSRGPRPSGSGAGDAGDRRSFGRRRRKFSGGGKVCPCCVQKVKYVDYKEIDFVQRFVSNQGKILPRRLSGACAKHQRMLTTAIKRARNLALLPFTA